MVDFSELGDWNKRTNAHQWNPDSIVQLFNVAWNSDYRDIVDFQGIGNLNTYLDSIESQRVTFERAVQLRPYEPIRLNIPFNLAARYNYIRVQAPAPPISYTPIPGGPAYSESQRDFFYFINDVQMVAPNTTQFHVQLDVWNTYRDYFSMGYGYVERGHVGIANTNDMSENGRKYLTVPEGLDLGNEYNIVETRREKIADTDSHGIAVWSTTDLLAAPETPSGDPRLRTAQGTQFGDIPNGASAYYFRTRAAFVDWMRDMADYPWITQGIIGVFALPPISRYATNENNYFLGSDGDGPLILRGGNMPPKYVDTFPGWRDVIRNRIPARYRHLSKFLTYPYCLVELTCNTGSPLVLKPEQWGSDGQVAELAHMSIPNPRIVVFPYFYNRAVGANNPGGVHDGGEFLDMTTGIYDLPQFSIVNDGYLGYMASNRNAIQYQNSSADWSQQKALRGADTAHSQASQNAQTQDALASQQIGTMNQQTAMQNQFGGVRAGVGAVQGMAQGAMFGGGGGLAMGAANAASAAIGEGISQVERTQGNAISTGAVRDANRLNQNNSKFQRDTNRELSQFAAKGDYAQAIAGINAKVQDAKLTQPNTSGQMGGEAFNLVNDQWGYDVKVKMVNSGAMRAIGEYWLRYGYNVNAFFRPPNFSVMSKFTYWKFQEFNIQSSTIPEVYKQAIRGIFEKGVTIWREPQDIGRIDPGDNEPVRGAYYV